MGLPSDLYDRDYFLSDRCEGLGQFEEGGLSAIKRVQVGILDPQPGMRMLDAGCGRGELLRECAALGASVAGMDYSEAAVGIARETLAGVGGADIRQADVEALPWPDDSFDLAMFGDVIEHLYEDQAAAALAELRRVLSPGGLLLVHTAPNRRFLDVGWPIARLVLKSTGKGNVAGRTDEWISESKRYHVNEQTTGSLRRALESAGFSSVKAWIDPNVAREGHEHHLTDELSGGLVGRAGARVAAFGPFRQLFGNDLYATGRA